MEKESRQSRTRSTSLQSSPGAPTQADSGQAGEGGSNGGVFVNERGEVCYGNECLTLAIDQERNEIRVNIKRSDKCDVDELVEALRNTLGDGARTVYEMESEHREKK